MSQDAAEEFATVESPFPFSTIDWDDLIADEIAFSKSMPFTTIDSDDFILVLGLTQWDDMDEDICWNWLSSTILRNERRKHASKKKYVSLEIFLNLPHDLILEIFGHLHLIDVYHLGQTNKELRRIVMTNHGLSLWKAVFKNDPRLPWCPPDLSEPRWAALLFGPDICGECGRHGALVDFIYRKHFCTGCIDRNYMLRVPDNVDEVPIFAIDHSVWDLVPVSNRITGNRYWDDPSDIFVRYLRQDVLSMAKTVEQYQVDIKSGKPDAKQIYEEFEKHTKEHVAQLKLHNALCTRWATGLYDEMRDESERQCKDVMDRIEARLVSRGHLPCDIEYAHTWIWNLVYGELSPNPRLTRRVWRHILPVLEDVVNTQKSNRLERERQEVLGARALIISDVYDEYKRTLDPRSWPHLPTTRKILLSEPFWTLYNNASDAPLDLVTCADGISQLPTIISKWRDELLDKLASSVPIQPIFLDRSIHIEPEDRPPMLSVLELATSVFTCRGCRQDCDNSGLCLIGCDDVMNHLSCLRMFYFEENELTASSAGHSAATAVIHLLGLDPQTVTAKELDKIDARFLCGNCPVAGFRRVWGHKAFTWRECVAHAIENETEHQSNYWQQLTPQAGKFVRRHEQPMFAGDKSWSCTHCAVHLNNYVTRREAIEHAKAMHSAENPVVDEDVFYYPGPDGQHFLRNPVVLQQEPLAEFACNQCPDLGTRLFAMRALGPHLLDKHKISDPVIGKDYVKIELIARVSPSVIPDI